MIENKLILYKICKECGKDFISSYPNSCYCSDQCRMLGIRKSSFERAKSERAKSNKALLHKNCEVCGKMFETCHPFQKFCSGLCRKEVYSSNKYYNFEHSALFRLRFEIFKRDNFSCQYCGKNPIENGCKLNIDHIIPRNRGGTNESSNLITACEECNLGKGDILLTENSLKKQREVKIDN